MEIIPTSRKIKGGWEFDGAIGCSRFAAFSKSHSHFYGRSHFGVAGNLVLRFPDFKKVYADI